MATVAARGDALELRNETRKGFLTRVPSNQRMHPSGAGVTVSTRG